MMKGGTVFRFFTDGIHAALQLFAKRPLPWAGGA